ncbi:MAG: DivIVA domain-containing protein, partial [Ilumatobacteraceae bacterium]
MEMSPNQVRTASFASARKGWDPSEVTAFLERAADALESAQNHATAMEARARAAVSKLQEFGNAAATQPSDAERPSSDEHAETISRTLLLAQRAADEAIAEANQEAERIVAEARVEARRVDSEERDLIRSEVQSLAARREFLQSDVEQLENFLLDQRERLRSAAATLIQMAEQVPGGLGYLRPPAMSASDDETPGGTPREGTGASHDDLRIDPLDFDDTVAGSPDHAPAGDDSGAVPSADPSTGPTADPDPAPGADEPVSGDDDTRAMPTIRIGDDDGAAPGSGTVGSDEDPTPEGLPLRLDRD